MGDGFPSALRGLSDRLLALSRDSFGDGMKASLADLGQLGRAERVYVFLLSPDGHSLDRAYEWCAPGVPGHDFSSLRGVPVSAFPWSMEQFLRGGTIYVRDATELPPEAVAERHACEALGIGAYVNLPLFVEDRLVGWLGFDTNEPEPGWASEDLSFMAAAGRMLIRTIDRAHREETLVAEQAVSRRLAALGVFAAGLAHEINNPLAYVTMSLELLQRRLEAAGADEDSLRLTRDAIHGVDRIAQTIHTLRSFSKVGSGKRIPVHVGRAIDDALRLLAPSVQLRAQLERRELPDLWVMATAADVSQVVANIVRNAVENLPEGRASQHTVQLSTRVEDERVVIECVDSGPGFDEAALAHAFEPFFTTRGQTGGTGIGLALCHSIVTGLGGAIAVSNSPEGGARVRVELPRTDAPENRSGTSDRPENRRRVLLVEDDEMLRKVLGEALEQHEVVTVEDGTSAIALLEEDTAWDVILCDVLMPSGTGRDVRDYVVAHAPHLDAHLVFTTGGASNRATADFLRSVPNKVLSKPFSMKELLDLVAQFPPVLAP